MTIPKDSGGESEAMLEEEEGRASKPRGHEGKEWTEGLDNQNGCII